MASFYWINTKGDQVGPIDETNAIGLVKTGMIGGETLVWSEGMANWAPAKSAPVLADYFRVAPPPPPHAARPAADATFVQSVHRAPASGVETYLPAADGAAPLHSEADAWGLFWRIIVVVIGSLLIIPSPWTSTMYNRYLAVTTKTPEGNAMGFDGRPGDIWWVFVLLGLCQWIGALSRFADRPVAVLSPLGSLLSIFLSYLVLRWFVAKIRPDGQTLAFKGGFWGYIGYILLMCLAVITIIGWAWVLKFFLAWVCRNIEGPVRFEFRGTGWGILWRFFVAGVVSSVLVTIPWMMAWIVRWTVSQIFAAPARA